ncbi:Uma2 family endonuclease [Butyrivibrio sp. AE2032]|uniref:Uma2 family endonuclease n=1 Tax=Butyrivibrio sp. AE2032 TaxID=1458463 RepID=UPI000689B555|nr:Uma2 family endonuclease [Butyrivibrio sp. AE2032]
MDIKELKERKKALKLTTAELAYLAELPVSTVSKIMTGETKKPSYMTIEKIDKVLSHEEMLSRVRAYADAILKYIQEHPNESVDQIQFEKNYRKEHGLDNAPLPYAQSDARAAGEMGKTDGSLALSHMGNVTVQMLDEIGEDRRIELIDGHLIINEYPKMRHQMVVQNLGRIIDDFIRSNSGDCKVFSVGVNVYLDEDDYTLVVPDIVVLCDDSRLNDNGIVGPPDWGIEVTSPSTRIRDYGKKMHKYMDAGVREYWIIDLEKEKVTTYIEGEPMMVYIYSFEDEIPVYIYDGKLEVCVGTL